MPAVVMSRSRIRSSAEAPPDVVFVRGVDRRSVVHVGASASGASRRRACGVRPVADARQAWDGAFGSRPGGAVDRDDDGRRAGGDGRRRVEERCALDGALRALAWACCSRRRIRSVAPGSCCSTPGSGGRVRPITRGRRPKEEWRERLAGVRARWASRPLPTRSPASGRPRSPRMKASATGSSGTCGAASALAPR